MNKILIGKLEAIRTEWTPPVYCVYAAHRLPERLKLVKAVPGAKEGSKDWRWDLTSDTPQATLDAISAPVYAEARPATAFTRLGERIAYETTIGGETFSLWAWSETYSIRSESVSFSRVGYDIFVTFTRNGEGDYTGEVTYMSRNGNYPKPDPSEAARRAAVALAGTILASFLAQKPQVRAEALEAERQRQIKALKTEIDALNAQIEIKRDQLVSLKNQS